jgi:2-oxoglutarate dehydrogenase E2 component (dihydrolipoamide succinyltransferase)
MATQEGISYSELDKITGTGMDGRVTRDDVLKYIEEKKKGARKTEEAKVPEETGKPEERPEIMAGEAAEIKAGVKQDVKKVIAGDEVIEMDRIRKLIAEHMVMSKRTSAHVTSFIDADVTRMISGGTA